MHDGYLIHNLLLFGRVLRGLGIDFSPNQMLMLIQALDSIPMSHKTDFYHAARCVFVHRQQDLALFDAAFAVFWRQPLKVAMPLRVPTRREREAISQPLVAPPQDLTPPMLEAPEGEGSVELQARRTYSAHEQLRYKDFASLTPDELVVVKRLLAGLAWQFDQRRTRRWQPGNGAAPDHRRVLRQALRHGGEVLEWVWRKPRYRPRPVIILADISGSMEPYSRLLIHFSYSLSSQFTRRVEAFVFSTRLTRITQQLRNHDLEAALLGVARRVPDWSGGTRIGQALRTFNYDWARRVLGRGAVVLLISDGWDRGDLDLLRREIARLQRSCYRLVWLNPLLGLPGYEPLTAGMRTALPYVDAFLPVHNLASYEDLARYLAQLDGKAGWPVRPLA